MRAPTFSLIQYEEVICSGKKRRKVGGFRKGERFETVTVENRKKIDL